MTDTTNNVDVIHPERHPLAGITPDDEVVYCHYLDTGIGQLVHDSEIVSEVAS